MTKPNSLDPPKLATRLMEQFSPVLKNAPLAGDLMEAFKQGRSSGWYWRQVFWAILIALLNFFRKRWGYLVYAALCSGLISITWVFMLSVGPSSALRTIFALYVKGYGIQWPWSLVYQIAFLTIFQAVIVACALIAYLACFRIVNPGKVLRALILIVVVLASGNVASTLLGSRISTTPTDLVPSIPTSCEVKVTAVAREGVSAVEFMPEGQVKCSFILSGIRFSYAFVWMLFSTPAMLALLIGIWKANQRNLARPTHV